jgi:hypothetical protein
MVDQVNRMYYEYLDPAGHRTWRKLYLMSVLFTLLRNGWALFNEYRIYCTLRDSGLHLSALENVETSSLLSFIINLCNQVSEEF